MRRLQEKACSLYGGFIYFSPLIDRLLKISVPFLVVILYLLFLASFYPYDRFLQIGGLLLLYFIPPAGRETIIPAAVELGFEWWIVAVSIVVIDIGCCLFMLWNFELVCRLPVLGSWIRAFIRKGEELLQKHAWLERLAVIGLVIFIFIPFQGTGSVSGTILGKISGMRQVEVFFAILAGSTLSSFLIGFSAYALNQYFSVNLWYLVAIILGIIVLVSIVSYLVILLKNRNHRSG